MIRPFTAAVLLAAALLGFWAPRWRRDRHPPSSSPTHPGDAPVAYALSAAAALIYLASVWSSYGEGYGFVPLILPVVALAWLRRRRRGRRSSRRALNARQSR